MIREDVVKDQLNNKTITLSFRRAWFIAFSFLVMYIVVIFLFRNIPFIDSILSYFLITILYSAVAITLYLATKSSSSTEKHAKMAWGFLMFAVITSLIGNILWAFTSLFYNQNPTTSVSNIFYLLFYPLFLVGILLFPSSNNEPRQRFKRYFDIVIIMFSVSLIFWIFLIVPVIQNFKGDTNALFIMSTNILGGFLLIFAMFDLLFNRIKRDIYAPVLLLFSGIFVLVLTNSIYVYQIINGIYGTGGPADFGWLLGYTLIGLAGVSQFNHQKIHLDLIEKTMALYKNYTLTPYLALAAVSGGYISLIWAYNTYNPNLTFLEFGVGILIVLVVIRQFISINENKNLYWQAQREITLRKGISKSLKDSELAYRTIFENTGNATVIIDEEGIISLANTEFERLSGYSKNEIEGERSWTDFVFNEDLDKMNATNQLRLNGNEFDPKNYEFRFVDRYGELKNIYSVAVLIPASKGSLISLIDITDIKNAEIKIKKSLEEKETLLKEIHHRVKNNLTVISSLLNLQSKYIKDKDDLMMFKESQSRAKSMALIHQRLYDASDLKRIDFGDYMQSLANDIFITYVHDPGGVDLKIDVEDIRLDINTSIPLGLILNELITNSMKYAFPLTKESIMQEKFKKGNIHVRLYKHDDGYTMSVEDDGVGLPDNFSFEKSNSLGLQLIKTLTEQIDGRIYFSNNNGALFRIDFKDKEY